MMDKNTLVDLLVEDMIKLNIKASSWEDAVKIGVGLLIESGGVEKRYLESIFKMIGELGPYVVVCPGIALVHAGPNEGVNRTCFSLITLKKPVDFGVPENDPIDIVFCFASPSKEGHMHALRQLALFCSESSNLDKIRQSDNSMNVRDLLVDYLS